MINLQSFAFDPDDSEDVKLEKMSIFLVAGSCTLAGCVWTLMYYLVFGLSLTTLLPFIFVVVVGAALAVSHRTRNHRYAVFAQIICIMYITTLIQWSIGGLFDSGFVLVWSFLGPITALMFFSFRRSVIWFALYFVNLVITVVFDDFFGSHGHLVERNTQTLFFIMNLGVSSLVVFVFAGYFVVRALDERARANQLLLGLLPRSIARILKTSHEPIADRFECVSVLFADIAGSTVLFADLEPMVVVEWLNEVFSALDNLVEQYGLEKLRSMGDNYMVAAGIPVQREDHALILARFAIDMLAEIDKLPTRNGKQIRFRIGINSGPLVAGVIGKQKFHYDVWGDAVNIASRMESHGEVGKIHISQNTYELIKNDFECVSRGSIPIKGKGEMPTWFLVAQKRV
jgi:guanylate cyclase